MKPKPKKPSLTRMLLVTILGLLIGLVVGLAIEYYGTPPIESGASTFNTTDRYGQSSTVTVTGHTPVYIMFPALGASVAFLWMVFLRISRGDEQD